MKILVINCGSSSIKYCLFGRNFNSLVEGIVERIGEKKSKLTHIKKDKKLVKEVTIRNHREGMTLIEKILTDKEWGAIKSIKEITAVGHRIVHGGEIAETTVASNENLEYLKEFELLAPLHNPHNIRGIKMLQKIMPNIPQLMVFDTEFHQTMPKKAYLYGLPYEFFEKYKVRRYGFHGISHKYVFQRATEITKKRKLNIITCHLGAGSSIAAIKKGKVIDTSMGMTPLEGLMMATRSGDFDPAILQYLTKKYGFSYDELYDIANNKSGLLGVSGVSKDIRTIEEEAKKGNERCVLALEIFCYRVAKYIGSYAIALGEVDSIVFTGGIGENAYKIRDKICSYLKILGVKIDNKKNRNAIKKEMEISTPRSKIKVLVIPTNEELAIAKEVARILKVK